MGRGWAVFVLGWCATVPALAQSPGDTVPVPSGVDRALRVRLAREWGVEPSRLVVTYGRLPDSVAGLSLADVRYASRGGRLLITFELPGGGLTTSTGRAGVLVRVPVANRLLLPGETLDQHAFRWQEQTAWGPPAAPTDSAMSGYLVRGRIVAGQRITPALAIPPPAVRAGLGITLRWSDASITLELDGVALGTGYVGDRIPVRLHGDGDRVFATITGPGTAQLRER